MNEGFAIGMTMRDRFAFALGSVRWRDKSRLRGPFLSHGSVKDAAVLETALETLPPPTKILKKMEGFGCGGPQPSIPTSLYVVAA
jgi:hypothetical protein